MLKEGKYYSAREMSKYLPGCYGTIHKFLCRSEFAPFLDANSEILKCLWCEETKTLLYKFLKL